MEKKGVKRFVFGILVFFVLLVMFLNILVLKNENFWDASVTSCLTLLVALVVSFYFTQKNLDERRQKESYLKLLEKTQIEKTQEIEEILQNHLEHPETAEDNKGSN